LGSASRLTDGSQNVTDTYLYKAFGEIVLAGTTVNPFQFVGMLGYYLDRDLAQYHARARNLQSLLARWLSTDRSGVTPQDVNLFVYVANRPVIYQDPSGLHYGVCHVAAFDGSDTHYGPGIANWTYLFCNAKAEANQMGPAGGVVDIGKGGAQAIVDYANKNNCCISELAINDHGAPGVLELGAAPMDATAVAKICNSLCPGATVTLYACNSATAAPPKPSAIEFFVKNCKRLKSAIGCMGCWNSNAGGLNPALAQANIGCRDTDTLCRTVQGESEVAVDLSSPKAVPTCAGQLVEFHGTG
jgi:RHS repeat-associated protein